MSALPLFNADVSIWEADEIIRRKLNSNRDIIKYDFTSSSHKTNGVVTNVITLYMFYKDGTKKSIVKGGDEPKIKRVELYNQLNNEIPSK